MQSQKSEKSQQDFVSYIEQEFLQTYLLYIIQEECQHYLYDSELEMSYYLSPSQFNQQAIVSQKRQLFQKPNNYFFASRDFQLDEMMSIVSAQLALHDFKDEEFYDQVKTKSPTTRRKLFLHLQTSSFGEDKQGNKADHWIPLNNKALQIKKGSILLFYCKLKLSSYSLSQLKTHIQGEISHLTNKLTHYIEKYEVNIIPIILISADINYPFEDLEWQTYYLSKQNLQYHFVDTQKVQQHQDGITEPMITIFNLRKVTSLRMKVIQWTQKFEEGRKEQKETPLTALAIGSAVALGILYYFKRKL